MLIVFTARTTSAPAGQTTPSGRTGAVTASAGRLAAVPVRRGRLDLEVLLLGGTVLR
jgi:hypothetical protein